MMIKAALPCANRIERPAVSPKAKRRDRDLAVLLYLFGSGKSSPGHFYALFIIFPSGGRGLKSGGHGAQLRLAESPSV